ncbi:MAG: ABC transporter ATP-binding protein [Dehalococcoidia bacterium]
MIEVQNVTKKFGRTTALDTISFHVNEGEIFGYLGPNGAGKTTTMRIMLGLLKPTSGKALVWGKDLGDHNMLRGHVGVLLENDGLYERLSAYENLNYYASLYGVADREKKIKDLLDLTELADRKDDKVGNFSKGMKRKLGLARALVHDPGIIFFDEPSAGLDPEAQKMVRDLIVNLSSEKRITVFLNSHDLDEVQRICSRVAILKQGTIMVSDALDNLRNRHTKPVVEMVFADESKAGAALDIVKGMDYVEGCERHNSTLTITLKNNGRPAGLLSVVIEQGIEVEEMKKITKSLEEVYLETVGKKNENE